MTIYRKSEQLRLRRVVSPEPPFWYATAVGPYGARRSAPLSIDYFTMRAAGAERAEVTVCEDVTGELARQARLDPPLLIDATESGEIVYRRGEEAAAYSNAHGLATITLVSTASSLPPSGRDVAVASWPPDVARLRSLGEALQRRGTHWGLMIPVVYPATTRLEVLSDLAAMAAELGAGYLVAAALDLDPPARQMLAESLALDDEEYETLFHSDTEQLQVATERHVAALAGELGLPDFVTPPGWPAKSNWNASILLTLTAARMIAMQQEVELAGTLARAARVVAVLDKPLSRIAEAANLSIVDGLDEVALDVLAEWLERGRSAFADRIGEQWRLRRDHGIAGVRRPAGSPPE